MVPTVWFLHREAYHRRDTLHLGVGIQYNGDCVRARPRGSVRPKDLPHQRRPQSEQSESVAEYGVSGPFENKRALVVQLTRQ
jgi:hypothetical protein